VRGVAPPVGFWRRTLLIVGGTKGVTMVSTALDANKAVVSKFYEGAVAGDLSPFRAHMHADFVCNAPAYLPWGGPRLGVPTYFDKILPMVARVLDFDRFSYDGVTAEENRVVVRINVGVKGSGDSIRVIDYWTLKDLLVVSVWVSYFEPQNLLEQILRNTKRDAGLAA
jgi:ketosteroid isomerase-like protein